MKIPELLLEIQRTLPDGVMQCDIAGEVMGLPWEQLQRLAVTILVQEGDNMGQCIVRALLTGALIAERHARTKRPN